MKHVPVKNIIISSDMVSDTTEVWFVSFCFRAVHYISELQSEEKSVKKELQRERKLDVSPLKL